MSKNKSCEHKMKIPDAGQPLVFFLMVTVVFFFVSYNNSKVKVSHNYNYDFPIPDNQNIITMLIYIGVLVVGNYFINLNISKEVCGTPMFFKTFIVTLLPWVLIFIVLSKNNVNDLINCIAEQTIFFFLCIPLMIVKLIFK